MGQIKSNNFLFNVQGGILYLLWIGKLLVGKTECSVAIVVTNSSAYIFQTISEDKTKQRILPINVRLHNVNSDNSKKFNCIHYTYNLIHHSHRQKLFCIMMFMFFIIF